MSDPIIHSLLDTDLYKFTMMQAVLHQFPAAEVEYQFRCRTKGIDFTPCRNQIQREINALCELRFRDEELRYLGGLDYIKSDFIEFLRLFQLNPRFVTLTDGGEALSLTISGPWLHTILYEVPLLAIVSEVYSRMRLPPVNVSEGRQRLAEKIALVKQAVADQSFSFTDFGTRRRFSRTWHEEVVTTLKQQLPKQFIGTSNVDLARRLGLSPIGTMAHEFLQGCQALGPRLVDSQKFALEAWTHEYRGRLGIALTDVIGMDAFLRDFDLYFAKLFDGLRHDSGDPFQWADKAIEHYRRMNIDPASKALVFSDSLSMHKALEIYRHYKDVSRPVFGIGTHLTNDVGAPPLDIVIKMTRCNGQPVAKISDSPGKIICEDQGYLRYLAQVFQVNLKERA